MLAYMDSFGTLVRWTCSKVNVQIRSVLWTFLYGSKLTKGITDTQDKYWPARKAFACTVEIWSDLGFQMSHMTLNKMYETKQL